MRPTSFDSSRFSFDQNTWEINGRLVSTFKAFYNDVGKEYELDLTNVAAIVMDLIPVPKTFGSGEKWSTKWDKLKTDLSTVSPMADNLVDDKAVAANMNVVFKDNQKYVDLLIEAASEALIEYLLQFKDEKFIHHVDKCLTFDDLDTKIEGVKILKDEGKTFNDIKAIANYINASYDMKLSNLVTANRFLGKYYSVSAGIDTKIIHSKGASIKMANLVGKKFYSKFVLRFPTFTLSLNKHNEPNKVPPKISAIAMEVIEMSSK